MVISTNNILNTINHIAANHPAIKRIGIFGSYARGDATFESDIDLLYDYIDNNDIMIDDAIKCLSDIQRVLGDNIDFVAYDDILNIKSDSDIIFKNNVLNDVIWIYERWA